MISDDTIEALDVIAFAMSEGSIEDEERAIASLGGLLRERSAYFRAEREKEEKNKPELATVTYLNARQTPGE